MRGLRHRPWGLAAALLLAACASKTPQTATLHVSSGASSSPTSTDGGSTANNGGASSSGATATPTGGGTATPTPAPTGTGATTAPTPTPSATGTSSASPTPTPKPTSTTSGSSGSSGGGAEAPSPTPVVPVLPVVSTFAGRGQVGWIDADGSNAEFTSPQALVVRGSTLFVADGGDNRIRRIDLTGNHAVTTVAGSGAAAYLNGIGQQAAFNGVRGLAVDASGNLYVADAGNYCIRKIDMSDASNPVVTTFAGSPGVNGHRNDQATGATFGTLAGLTVRGTTLYVADMGNHCVRAIELGASGFPVTDYAGNGQDGTVDGSAGNASFRSPAGLATDASGNLYVSDATANVVRMVSNADSTHPVTVIAGSGSALFLDGDDRNAAFKQPWGLAVGPDGLLYVADMGNAAVRSVAIAPPTHAVKTFAGTGSAGFMDGQVPNAQFANPAGLAWSGSALYVADGTNARVRLVR